MEKQYRVLDMARCSRGEMRLSQKDASSLDARILIHHKVMREFYPIARDGAIWELWAPSFGIWVKVSLTQGWQALEGLDIYTPQTYVSKSVSGYACTLSDLMSLMASEAGLRDEFIAIALRNWSVPIHKYVAFCEEVNAFCREVLGEDFDSRR